MTDAKIITVQNFIGGEFMKCECYLESYEPSTGEVWARIPDSDAEHVDAAVQAAKKAFPRWSKTPVSDRSKLMLKAADILESRLSEFASLESRDQGKPVTLATKVDIPRAVHNLRIFATSVLHHTEKATYQEQFSALNYTSREPVGVAGLISPWNLPLYLLTFKLAPAIAAGNTVVCKPSEMTSVTAWKLCGILNEAGLPAGVVNMVFGTGPKVGNALTSHPDVPLISFTGSTATAYRIQEATRGMCKKLSLELGGKNAAVIFSDANLEKCIPTTIRSSFINQGEVCLCTSRIFVQRPIIETFVERFVAEARSITVGDPREANTWMGALVSREHMEKVRGYIKLAEEEGLNIACGGSNPPELPAHLSNGYYVRPTVVTNLPDSSRLMQEEIFGPVTCIVPFDSEDEVISRANSVDYGLCATVWSQDINTVHRVAKQLRVGTVWANCWLVRDLHMPFGGCKSSGVGRESVDDSYNFYTEPKCVCVQIN